MWAQGLGPQGLRYCRAERWGQLLGRTSEVLSAGTNEATATGSLLRKARSPPAGADHSSRPFSAAGRVVCAHPGAKPASWHKS